MQTGPKKKKVQAKVKVKVKVPLYSAKLVTFVPTIRCYVKVTLDDFINVTNDVIFLDKPTGYNTASAIMRVIKGHLVTQYDSRGLVQRHDIMFMQLLLLVKENS
jgi:hypothetical protein